MYKDGIKICIDKVYESATTEENGLEVDVNTEVKRGNSYSLTTKLIEGLKQLTFYDNIYIDDSEGIVNDYELHKFNNRKIADFKTFKICDCITITNSLLMGNVLYPINNDIIQAWFEGISQVPFAIKCNIGDVDVTPNREQLLYNQKTLDAINKSCQAALEEFKEICQTNFSSDFKTVHDWYNFIDSNYTRILIKQFENDDKITVTLPISKMSYYGLTNKTTICGKTPPNNLDNVYHRFMYADIPSSAVLYQYYNERFYVKNNRLNLNRYIDYYDEQRLYLVEEPLIPIAKRYFNNFRKDSSGICYFLYKKRIYSAFRKIVKDYCKSYNTKPTDPNLKFIYQNFVANYTNIKTYGLKDVPQSFIDAEKIRNQHTKSFATQQKARKCVIYQLMQGRSYNTVTYDTSLSFDDLKSYKGTVFFAEKGSPYLEQFYKITSKFFKYTYGHIKLVEVATSNIPLLRDLDNTVEFNSVFTKKNNVISKLCTYIYLCEKWNIERDNISYIDYIKTTAFKKLTNVIYTIARCYNDLLEYNTGDYEELLKILCKTYLKNNWLKYDIISIIETNKDYIKLNNLFSVTHDYKPIVLAFTDYVTKNGISNKEKFNSIKEILKPVLDEYTPNQQLPHFDT